jgi:probable F420-dependent oxidoreductase
VQIFAGLDARMPLSEVPRLAVRLERLGFDGIHVPETVHDAFAVALLAAEHTSRITVRTAVSLAFVRSPTQVAYNAWDLAVFSGGRFELGLGTQIRQNIEDRFGMPWTEPVPRMREYVGVVQELFAAFVTGEPVRYEGEHYRITRLQPYFNPGPAAVVPPPIFLGAVNPRMCELAGAVAVGVITHSTNSDPGYLRDVVRPALAVGAAGVARPSPPVVMASATVATGADRAAVEEARERQRRMLAFLYSTPPYRPTLERHGWPDLFDRLQALTRAERWDRLPEVITDDVLDALLVCGPYEALPELLLERYRGIADGVVMPAPLDEHDDDRLAGVIEAIRGG